MFLNVSKENCEMCVIINARRWRWRQLGVAAGPGDGDTVSRRAAREYWRRAAGQVGLLRPSGSLCQPAAHERHRQRTRPLPGQLHSQLRYVRRLTWSMYRLQLDRGRYVSVNVECQ